MSTGHELDPSSGIRRKGSFQNPSSDIHVTEPVGLGLVETVPAGSACGCAGWPV